MNIFGVRRALGLATIIVATASAQAVTFSDVSYSSSPLLDQASDLAIGNSISFFTPKAIVGDSGTDGLRSGAFTIEYSAQADSGMCAVQAVVTLGEIVLGSATIDFTEDVYRLNPDDTLGPLLATVSTSFVATSFGTWTHTLNLSECADRIRVIKSFDMNAPESPDIDFGAITIINQNLTLVPEPATMSALAIGAVALLRRRRK